VSMPVRSWCLNSPRGTTTASQNSPGTVVGSATGSASRVTTENRRVRLPAANHAIPLVRTAPHIRSLQAALWPRLQCILSVLDHTTGQLVEYECWTGSKLAGENDVLRRCQGKGGDAAFWAEDVPIGFIAVRQLIVTSRHRREARSSGAFTQQFPCLCHRTSIPRSAEGSPGARSGALCKFSRRPLSSNFAGHARYRGSPSSPLGLVLSRAPWLSARFISAHPSLSEEFDRVSRTKGLAAR
jgi:hypothetical protein